MAKGYKIEDLLANIESRNRMSVSDLVFHDLDVDFGEGLRNGLFHDLNGSANVGEGAGETHRMVPSGVELFESAVE